MSQIRVLSGVVKTLVPLRESLDDHNRALVESSPAVQTV